MNKILVLSLLGIIALLTACSSADPYIPNTEVGPEIHNLAECLTERDAVMYGTEWCQHCKAQKEMFGEAFAKITYVNCELNPSACNAAGVRSYPTWVINGRVLSATQQLFVLARESGCQLTSSPAQ